MLQYVAVQGRRQRGCFLSHRPLEDGNRSQKRKRKCERSFFSFPALFEQQSLVRAHIPSTQCLALGTLLKSRNGCSDLETVWIMDVCDLRCFQIEAGMCSHQGGSTRQYQNRASMWPILAFLAQLWQHPTTFSL